MKAQLFKDILKAKVDGGFKYSQGRIYLFVFVLCYISSLTYYMFIPNTTSMLTIIDALQWAILLFAAYVFGDKGVVATKDIITTVKGKILPSSTPAPNPTPTPAATEPIQNISDMAPTDMMPAEMKSGDKKEEDLCT